MEEVAQTESFGRCHICEQACAVSFCEFCGHWFCETCRSEWWERGLAAIRAMVGGSHPGCCGPVLH